MTRIILSGCSGVMGKTITDLVKDDDEAHIVAGIDLTDDGTKEYPIFSAIGQCTVEADVLIDFSTPKILDEILEYCEKNKLPAVLCATGYDEKQLAAIEAAAAC